MSHSATENPNQSGAQHPPGGTTTATPAGGSPKQWKKLCVLGLVALMTVAVVITGFSWGHYRWQHTIISHATVKGRVYAIGARIDGLIKTVEVEPGQQVVKGQTLIRLEDDHYLAAASEAQAQVQSAIERLAVEKLSIAQARQQMTEQVQHADNVSNAMSGELEVAMNTRNMEEQKYVCSDALFKIGTTSANSLDECRTQRDNDRALVKVAQEHLAMAQSDCRLAREQLDGLKVREAGLDVLSSEVELARQQLALCEADVAATVIRAPDDGWVIDRIVEPGGSAKVGEPMMSLWLGAPWIEAWASEKQLRHIQIGSPADVTLAAFPGHKLHGRVEAFGVLTDTELQAATDPQAKSVPDTLHSIFVPDSMVPVRIAVVDSPVRIQPGLTALVGIRDATPGTETSTSRIGRGEIFRESPQLAGEPPVEFRELVKTNYKPNITQN
jgi:membrane fusion protein (multidrug efflux system)